MLKIKDKSGTIIVVLLLVLILVEIFYFSRKNQSNENVINKEILKSEIQTEIKEEIKAEKLEKEKKSLIAYNNNKFKYEINSPENWFINTDNSENSLQKTGNFETGGQTFWSNYSNINDFSPSNHPKDFRMLALVIYKDSNSKNINEFAKKLEFDDDTKKLDFQAEKVKGMKFIAPSLVEGNPRVAIIFQKDDLFYVFRLAFIGGDSNVANEMENIIRSFKLL